MQTLICAFETQAAARLAVERLVAAGISREDVHLQEAVRDDSSIVAVDAHDTAQHERAQALMHELGAHDVDGTGVRVIDRAADQPLRDTVAEQGPGTVSDLEHLAGQVSREQKELATAADGIGESFLDARDPDAGGVA